MPVTEQSGLVALLYLNHAVARAWSAEDLALVRDMAERTRTATERLRVAAALRDSEARLIEANETLEANVQTRTAELMETEAALRQSQKMEAVGQLTGGIAHDFNNLLMSISGSLDLLDKRLSEGRLEGVGRFINAAQEASRRAAALTQRLLAFARRQTLDPKPVDVNRIIAGMADLVRRSVGPDVEVEVAQAGGLWGARLDPSQLENAILNLCINARDAMAPDGDHHHRDGEQMAGCARGQGKGSRTGAVCLRLRHRHRFGHGAGCAMLKVFDPLLPASRSGGARVWACR